MIMSSDTSLWDGGFIRLDACLSAWADYGKREPWCMGSLFRGNWIHVRALSLTIVVKLLCVHSLHQ